MGKAGEEEDASLYNAGRKSFPGYYWIGSLYVPGFRHLPNSRLCVKSSVTEPLLGHGLSGNGLGGYEGGEENVCLLLKYLAFIPGVFGPLLENERGRKKVFLFPESRRRQKQRGCEKEQLFCGGAGDL